MIDRFVNKDKIKDSSSLIEGVSFDYEPFMSLDISKAIVDEIKNPFSIDSHVYNTSYDLVKSAYNVRNDFDSTYDDINFDVCKLFFDSEIFEGTYKICFNFLYNIFGNIDNQYFYIQEISPDELELKLAIRPTYLKNNPDVIEKLELFKNKVSYLRTLGFINNIVINLGENKIYSIINIKVDCDNEYVIYVKLLKPIENLKTGNLLHICYKVAEDYFDSFTVTSPEIVSEPRTLTPNYSINTPSGESTNYNTWNSLLPSKDEDIYHYWDTLLDSNYETANTIINRVISSSASVPLNIDYSVFSNFVFYGSAQERLKNYNYKLQLIEFYNSQSNAIKSSNSSGSNFGIADHNKIVKRSYQVKNSFDEFENYLYYSSGSIFSYDITGSITPAPKYIAQNKYYNYHITSSAYNYWYSSSLSKARKFDSTNYNTLYEATPGHIVNDSDNSEYFVFLDMIGQHFDNLYAFTKELTSIHRRDEHPKRGIPNELLKTYAKSLGWEVNNGYQLSNLWLYKLGTDNTGSFLETGTLASQAHEYLTHQIWRRIVNNIPTLLKTKGTERSLKSLLSIYGIPQTLISIKEYGGARPPKYNPTHKSYRYQYLLKFDGNQFVKIPWGQSIPPNENQVSAPRVSEFRFNTTNSSSLSMSLWSIEDSKNSNKVYNNLELVSYRAFSTSSRSGSYAYGFLRYRNAQSTSNSTSSFSIKTIQSQYYPFFDGDAWNVRIYTDRNITNTKKTGSIHIEWKKSSGNFENWISFSGSMIVTSSSDISFSWGSTSSLSTPHNIILGGSTGSQHAGVNSSRYRGFLQAYKDYSDIYSEKVFEEHTLNPAAYHGSSYTASFDTLNRFYPMGVDALRYDHSTYRFVSSSHPNRIKSQYTTASFIGFSGSQENQYKPYSEIYYSYSPSIGASVIKSDKIRIEESFYTNQLSPEKRVQINTFDTDPVDSNKLAVVFSPTDQVNRDIANQYGGIDLDNLIGDPSDLYRDEYNNLRINRENYWKKYKDRNNYNKYIEIFSLYDYSIFEQIKQLVPARANLIAGILLEENILERAKVARKNPSMTNPQYEKTIIKTDSQVGEYILYTGSISYAPPVEMSHKKYTSSLDFNILPDFEQIKYSTSTDMPPDLELEYRKFKSELPVTVTPDFKHEKIITTLNYYDGYSLLFSDLDSHKVNQNGKLYEFGGETYLYKYENLMDTIEMNRDIRYMYSISENGKLEEMQSTINPDNDVFNIDSQNSSLHLNNISNISDIGTLEHVKGIINLYNTNGVNDENDINSNMESLYYFDDERKLIETYATLNRHLSFIGNVLHVSGSTEENIAYRFKRNGTYRDRILNRRKINFYDGNTNVISNDFKLDSSHYKIENIVGKVTNFNIDNFYNGNNSYNYVLSSSFHNFNSTLTKLQLKEYLYKNEYVINDAGNIYRNKLYVTQSIIESERTNLKYKKVVYHYSSSTAVNYSSQYQKNLNLATLINTKNYYSSSLVPTNYQYVEDSVPNRLRFTGCKLTGLDFNVDTTDTIDGGPVVEYREVSANQIIV
jgi:hypothetical protein